MTYRLNILRKHKLGLPDIQSVIAEMGPLEGARAFLDKLREDNQVVILSDTFYEFAHRHWIRKRRLDAFNLRKS